jgi:hypothetical protein
MLPNKTYFPDFNPSNDTSETYRLETLAFLILTCLMHENISGRNESCNFLPKANSLLLFGNTLYRHVRYRGYILTETEFFQIIVLGMSHVLKNIICTLILEVEFEEIIFNRKFSQRWL